MKVCLGGTFEYIHEGHKQLLNRALELGTEIFIGITSDNYCKKYKSRQIAPVIFRKKTLEKYISKMVKDKQMDAKKITISEIDDINGRAVDGDFDVIVVSEETFPRANTINEIRKRLNLKPLRIEVLNYVDAEDLLPFSSTRITDKEITLNGKRLKPLKIAICSTNPAKVQGVKSAINQIFPDLKIKYTTKKSSSGVSIQPFEDETLLGALNRAKNTFSNGSNHDYAISIEAGLFFEKKMKEYFDRQYCVVIDRYGRITTGHSAGFVIPPKVTEELLKGVELEVAFDRVYNTKNVGEKNGVVGVLTKNRVKRDMLVEQAVLMAFVPRLNGYYQKI